jgi:hypothetical protein
LGLDFSSLDLPENQRILLQLGLTFYWPDFCPLETSSSGPTEVQTNETNHHQTKKDLPENTPKKISRTTSKLPESIRLKLIPFLRPAHFLWTYPQFALDLMHDDLTPRKKLVKDIVYNLHTLLHWPKGSITYWPLLIPKGNRLLPDLELFIHGLKHINPLYILCFGETAFKVIFPDHTFCVGKFNYNNIIVQTFPDLDELLPDNRELKNKVWGIIKKLTP